MNNGKANFSYLSGDGTWIDFNWQGLELLGDGAFQLYSLPLFEGQLPKELATAQVPDGPAGIAVDVDGTIYFSDPQNHMVMRIDGCDGAMEVVACIGGKGDDPVRLNTPRGLSIPAFRRSLFVADSANNRVQIFSLASSQLVDIWGETGSESQLFDTPWAIAGDSSSTYVLDYGRGRVEKFNRAGELVSSFWETIKQSGTVEKPSDMAVYADEESTTVYIVDEASHSVFVFDGDGRPACGEGNNPLVFGSQDLKKPMGIAVTQDAVYVGDNELRRVFKFRKDDYSLVGAAFGYQGPVAALAFDNKGNLLLHTGASIAPLKLALGKGYRTQGVLWSKAISLRNFKVNWYRLQAKARRLATGAHLRLFVHTSNDKADRPLVEPLSDNPFADSRWRPRSEGPDQFSDVKDLYIGGDPARFLWVGALFSGDGETTPVLSQLRVEFDHDDYTRHLPAIYRGQSPCGDFLRRFLSLFESMFGEVESSIDDLSQLFDPEVAPKESLPWLAGWLAFEMDEDWSEEEQRESLSSAFEAYSRRGTVEGLRQSLRIFAGVSAIIEEPIAEASLWALPAGDDSCGCKKQGPRSNETQWTAGENSILGVTTMLAPAHAQGAVIGSTATLDQSHLITNEEFGLPLFDDVANQFSVQIYRSQLTCPERLAEVRAVIESEKPAHTTYHLCIIEPRMRVGYQSRLGIDTVVAGPATHMELGEQMSLGEDTALGGEPAGRVGDESRVGITTRIG